MTAIARGLRDTNTEDEGDRVRSGGERAAERTRGVRTKRRGRGLNISKTMTEMKSKERKK
jgi:hypothetical protein